MNPVPPGSGIPVLCNEDILTIKSRREAMECEFCARPSAYEIDLAIGGRQTIVLICGRCRQSEELMAEVIPRDTISVCSKEKNQ